MDKKNLVRYKAGLAALMIASGMTLGGCASEGFQYTMKDSKYVVADGSAIGNACIKECYVVEAYNSLTEESEIPGKYDFTKIESNELYKVYDNLGNVYKLVDQLRLKRRFK